MNYTVSFDIPEKRGSRIKRIYFVFYVAIVGLVFMATILLLRIYPNIITPYIPPSGQVHSVLQKSPILRTPATPNTYSSSEKRNIYAFGVEWDDSILTSIRESQDHIDTLIMEELTLMSSGMVVIDPEKFKKTKEYLATYVPHLPLYALINNHNQLTHIWDTNIVYSILSNKVKRRNLELKLRAFSLQNHLAGINIDFEALDQKTYPYYVLFIKELGLMLHSMGKNLSVDIPLSHTLFNLSEIIPSVDLIFLMAYDEHWSTSTSGPIASQGWFDQNIRSTVNTIPREKIVVTLGNYGYDWIIGEENEAISLTVKEVQSLIEETRATVILDPTSSNPMFYYRDELGRDHVVWYLDTSTVSQELSTLASFGIRNISVWRIGAEDPKIWNLLEKFVNNKK